MFIISEALCLKARGDSRQIFEIFGIEFGAQRASKGPPWENEVRLVFVLAVSGESSIGKGTDTLLVAFNRHLGSLRSARQPLLRQ